MKQSEKKCLLCDSQAFSRNLCKLCYAAERRAGRLDRYKPILSHVSIETRIKKTKKCWLWTGDKTTWGYGTVTTGRGAERHREMAHRYVYKKLVGPIPKGMVVMHKCDNPPCVRPSHLRLGTIADNNRDTAIKRRHHYGLSHWNGRLTDAQITAIRHSNRPHKELAEEFGCSQPYISRLKSGLRRV